MGRCGVFATWDDVSKEILDDIAANVIKQVEGAVQKDKHTLWQAPLSSSDLRPRFQVTKPRIRDVRDEMPPSLTGKKLSATLRNGDACEFRRSCACLVQSGRVCGAAFGSGLPRQEGFGGIASARAPAA